MTGRWSPLDWIRYEWNEGGRGVSSVSSSLADTRVWDHHLGPWLDPGNTPGVSVCRLIVEGRIVVLSRLRSGGSDSRRTLRAMAYLGGEVSPTARPTTRQALALAPEWAEHPPAYPEPVDLGELTGPFAGRRDQLERRTRAAARDLAPIVSAALRSPGAELAVISQGDPLAQLWGLVDIFESVLARRPETFSTYESDDRKQGAEIVFLRERPGQSSRATRRQRVNLQEPDHDDLHGEIAAYVVQAYAHGALDELTRQLGLTGDMPTDKRIKVLEAALSGPAPMLPPPAATSRTPQPRRQPSPEPPPQARSGPSAEPSLQASRGPSAEPPSQARREPSSEPLPRGVPTPAQRAPASVAGHDMVAAFQASLRKARKREEVQDVLERLREWLIERVPELERPLGPPEGDVTLRMLLQPGWVPTRDPDPDPAPAPRTRRRSAWLEPQWLVLAGLSVLILILQILLLLR
jgi:hypothetical protein